MCLKWLRFVRCSFLFGVVGFSLLNASTQPSFEWPVDNAEINREDPRYLTSYAPILKPAKEAVVAVHSARVMRVYRQLGMNPREEMLRRYFGLPVPERSPAEVQEYRAPEGVGSGVVISSDGYIVTNSHVITASDGDAADEILVQLNDGRELAAILVGRDTRSDLAVLKVDAENLPFLPVADSEKLEVGDIVFAIGNPMGVGLTITQGIVSATGRNNLSILGESGYESFIQTDAPINPGNSGGALVDAYGRLVGINTAIISRSGGSNGIGFAIPSSFAHSIVTSLIREGEVRRGILGVNIEDLDAQSAKLLGVAEGAAVLVQSVIERLPAANSGLKSGDAIVSINEIRVNSVAELRIRVAMNPPGSKIKVGFRRDGSLMELDVALADPEAPYSLGARSGELLDGVYAAVIDEILGEKYGLDPEIEGLVVTDLSPNSPYAESFAEGLVIFEINGVQPSSFDHALALMDNRKVSRFYVFLKGRSGYLPIRHD